jgi:hypothetical protein
MHRLARIRMRPDPVRQHMRANLLDRQPGMDARLSVPFFPVATPIVSCSCNFRTPAALYIHAAHRIPERVT